MGLTRVQSGRSTTYAECWAAINLSIIILLRRFSLPSVQVQAVRQYWQHYLHG